jgi:hypothetical protein
LDSERIARETLAHPLLPRAFKRAGQDSGPDELHELLALWHNQRRSILASRQHLLNEAETMLSALPLELREQLPDSKAVRPRLAALACRNRRRRYDAPTRLRLEDGQAEARPRARAPARDSRRLVAGSDLVVIASRACRGVARRGRLRARAAR